MTDRQQQRAPIKSQRHQEKVVVVEQRKRAPPEYNDFPHIHRPLYGDVIPGVEEGAYFLMYGDKKGVYKRALHKNCTGVLSTSLKTQAREFSEEKPVVVMDLSECPILLDEYEWPQAIMAVDPSYKYCTCSFVRYIEEEEEVKCHFYSIKTPYYYLCNLNKPGNEQVLLAHEQMKRMASYK